LLDDGLIELQVTSVSDTDVVNACGHRRRSLSAQRSQFAGGVAQISALTDKDRADLVFAAKQEVDYIALSFVRRPEDVMELKQLLTARGAMIPVIAKIENRKRST